MMTEAISLLSSFPSARDQGLRPTCLAFAVSDAHMLAAGRSELLSADYLHFHATRRAGVRLSAGVGLTALREALRLDGQPTEANCPYSESRAATWAPPREVGRIWTRASDVRDGKPTEILSRALLCGKALVVVLRISRSFHLPDPISHVVVEDGGSDGRLHAVLAVGVSTIVGDVAFLARNSWGTTWGQEGHAWLPATYVDSRATDVLELVPESLA